MRLLITTQAVDLDDPVLGFMHGWIIEFAKHCESVNVICLKEGRHNLPENVHIHSLGKESGASRFKYIFRFYKYIWTLRNEYDAVFVHMNQEYVLLGGKFWWLWGKRVVLWRNHKKGSFMTRIAAFLSDKVCYTSPSAYVAHYKNAIQMPIGIDTNIFVPPQVAPVANSIIFLGRIDAVKKPIEFIDALKDLAKNGIDFHADIYGDPTYPDDPYFAKFKTAAKPLQDSGRVTLHSSVANEKTPEIYGSHAIYVNLTPSGSFDKTIGEAMACGCLVVVANEVIRSVVDDRLIVDGDSCESVVHGLRVALTLTTSEREILVRHTHDYIEKAHSIRFLAKRLSILLVS